jgi:apolipoprotein N-acyltransferase
MESVRQNLNRWILPAVSGLFYALALPPFNHGEVGWVALIPLLYAIETCSLAEAFRRGYVTGLVFFGMTIWWLIHVSLPGMLALVGFLALYIALAAVFLAVVNRVFANNPTDAVWKNLLIGIIGAAGWTVLEWVRGSFILGGFGWNGLGVSQHATIPLIQFASYTGVYGVSALLFFLNYSLYCTVRRFVRTAGQPGRGRRLSWEFYFALVLPCAFFIHGIQLIRACQPSDQSPRLRLLLAQGNIPQTIKFDEREKPGILERYRSLTAAASGEPTDLIIWPETATPEALRYDRETFAIVTNAAIQGKAALLTGTVDVTPNSDPVEAFNAAVLVQSDGYIGEIYHKIHLVPFGEYVPLRKILPFMKWLTPITDSFERGREFTLFQLRDLQFGTVICFEDTQPNLYRQFVKRRNGTPGADFMVNLTNDGWFGESSESEIHLANAVFRAVENSRFLIRCTNNGITCVIDQFGVVRGRVAPFIPTTLRYTMTVPEHQPETFYTRHGDVFVGACGAVTVLFLLAAWRTHAFTIESKP